MCPSYAGTPSDVPSAAAFDADRPQTPTSSTPERTVETLQQVPGALKPN